jgi:coproporphyrinogen III oxidase-like Fe-S oxidoreductase
MFTERLLTLLLRRESARQARLDNLEHLISVPEAAPDRTYMLYLHVPFCQVLCPFCSFHRVEYRESKAHRYFGALRQEIRLAKEAGYRFDEVYVGGGTPTVHTGELLKTLDLLRRLNPLRTVSVEANPDDLQGEKLAALRDAGVDRLSVGVQSLEDRLLKEMERYDKYGSGARIVRRLEDAKGIFRTLNVDMIFNLPHQTLDSLSNDVDRLTRDVGVDQISFYPLMGATSTRHAMRRGMGKVTYGRERRFYEAILDRMPDVYRPSSAWCFSRGDGVIDEYVADRDDYVGLGSGAMSYLNGTLYAASFSINRYIRLVNSGHSGITRQHRFGLRDQMRYYFLMRLFGLELDKELAKARWQGRFRRVLWRDFAFFRALGAIEDTGTSWKLTRKGMYVWVLMMREFFIAVSNFRDLMRIGIRSELDPEDLPAVMAQVKRGGRSGLPTG